MNNLGIETIVIKLDDNQKIIATPDMFNDLYISNIDENGDEISFFHKENSNYLKANFFMIKLSGDIVEYNLKNDLKANAFSLLKDEKLVKEVRINFKNGHSQPFIFEDNNILTTINDNSDLCLLQSEYDIKYKANLFA